MESADSAELEKIAPPNAEAQAVGAAGGGDGGGTVSDSNSKMKKKGVQTPLWRCDKCGWYLYGVGPQPHCPLCTNAPSLPRDLAPHERVPPWRPDFGLGAEDATPDADDDDDDGSASGSSDDEDHQVEVHDDDDDDDDELEMMMGGGGWHPLKAAPRQQQQREVKTWNVGTVGQKRTMPPVPQGATRFVCISDTHNKHRSLDLPAGDVLIHSGDFSLSCKEKELIDFTEWLHDQPFAHKIVVAGNHDVLMHSAFYERHHWRFHTDKVERHLELKQRLQSVCTYLEDDQCEINGIKIWGSPWVPYYHDWAFMLPDDEGLAAAWARVPAGVDVLITHGPPHKIRDQSFHGAHVGCTQLAEALKRIKPAVHCFGHVHSGYGVAKQRDTTFINAAIVNTRYKVANSPVVVDIK